jgi:aryl-alcohol dehydrogenase-like predicted oxidoreductase
LDHRTLGTAGPAVSLLGLGCNNFGARSDFAATQSVVHKALDLGVTLFDTADTYGNRGGSEEFLGRILGERRKTIVLATKFGMAMDDAGILKGASRRHIMHSVEGSLKRLRTDWIDLYQLHRPDPLTPIEETLRALDDLVQQGKVRHIGCSYLTGAELALARATATRHGLAAFITCQNEYNLLERDLVPEMTAQGLGLLPYLPLAGGMLTGKYRRDVALPAGSRLADTGWLAGRYLTATNWRIIERLEAFAAARGHTLLDLAFAWLAANPLVSSIIAGATSAGQIEANHRALAWRLSPDEKAEIDRLT